MRNVLRSLTLPLVVVTLAACSASHAQSARLCSRGANDGAACSVDEDCSGGACVDAQGVCDGGSSDGNLCACNGGICSTRTLCPSAHGSGTCVGGDVVGRCCDVHGNCRDNAACVGTQRICLSGNSAGSPCVHDSQCLGGMCDSTGKVCSGGSADGFTCNEDSHCPSGSCSAPVVSPPTPVPTSAPPPPDTCINPSVPTPAPAKAQFICSGGNQNGRPCASNTNCRHGQCVIGLGVCLGGANDGNACVCPSGSCLPGQCSADPSLGKCRGGPAGSGAALCCDPALGCGDAPCMPTNRTCAGGTRKRIPCLNDAQCPGSSCVQTGQFCEGGTSDAISCASDADCPGGHCALLSPPEGPICTPKPTPTETSTRVPTSTRGVPNAQTPTPKKQPASGGSNGSSATSNSGCTMGTAETASPLLVVAMILMLLAKLAARPASMKFRRTLRACLRGVRVARWTQHEL